MFLPSTINRIGQQAFASCPNLEKIVFTRLNTTILNSLLNPDYMLYLEGGEKKLAFSLYFGSSEEINLTKYIKYYYYQNQCLSFSISNWFVFYGEYIIGYVGKEKKIILPESVVGIAEDAFADNKFIESVTFNNKCKTVGSCAFDGCINLSVINMNKLLEVIGHYAFANTAVKNIIIRRVLWALENLFLQNVDV